MGNDVYERNMLFLVQLYQQHECLYNVASRGYHNRMRRENALQAICNEFKNLTGDEECTVDAISKKIRTCRTQYLENISKIAKSKNSGAGTDEVYQPKWFFCDSLTFLQPYTKARQGESSLQYSSKIPDQLENESVVEDDNELEDGLSYLDAVTAIKEQKKVLGKH